MHRPRAFIVPERKHMFRVAMDGRVKLLREIDAKKYLHKVAIKYKIPMEEQNET